MVPRAVAQLESLGVGALLRAAMATWLTELPTPFGRLCTCIREDAWDRAKMAWLNADLAINLSKCPTRGAG